MGVTRDPDDGEPTVVMPARAVADAVPPEITRFIAASKRARRRRLALYGAVAIIFLAGMAAGGWFLFPRSEKRVAASGPPPVTRPQATQPANLPASPPAPRMPDKPSSPRQMLEEIFDGRERGHSVTASVYSGAVRISSSKPGYVYVLAASASESGALFAAVLFPRAADTNNRIQPGQPLTLPDLRWPTDAEFLAIVSDEPRDIDVLGSLAGKVVCAPASRCSEAYGAVAFRARRHARDHLEPRDPACAGRSADVQGFTPLHRHSRARLARRAVD
jgi:hypothetical protein